MCDDRKNLPSPFSSSLTINSEKLISSIYFTCHAKSVTKIHYNTDGFSLVYPTRKCSMVANPTRANDVIARCFLYAPLIECLHNTIIYFALFSPVRKMRIIIAIEKIYIYVIIKYISIIIVTV